MMTGEKAQERLPFVSLVMPIRNEGRFIRESLSRLLEQDYPGDRVEILIADGMSTDGTRETVKEFQRADPRIRLIDNPGGIVSTGLNAALPQASGEIVIRVDGHCELDRSYVRRCVEHLRRPNLGAVGGPLTTVGQTPLASAIATAMSSRFGVGDSTFRVGTDTPVLVDTVAFPAYPRSILDQAGPFDEELVRNQDDEYSYRLREMGLGILLAPDVRAVYHSRSSLRSLWSQYFQYGYWKVRVMQKHPGQMRPRQFVPPLFVSALAIGGLAALVSGWGVVLLAAVLVPYALLNIAASFVCAARNTWGALPFLPLTFAVLHLSYGAGFLTGLAAFVHRWRDRTTRSGSVPGWLKATRAHD
jgi:succinoglycan biosynthesis protein ExoA